MTLIRKTTPLGELISLRRVRSRQTADAPAAQAASAVKPDKSTAQGV